MISRILFLAVLWTAAHSQEIKLIPSQGDENDRFGQSVALYEDYAVIGANQDHPNFKYPGAVYLFQWDGEEWMQETELVPSDGEADDWFGWSVAMGKDNIVVGAPYGESSDYYSGAAYVFRREADSWIEYKIGPTDPEAAGWFGSSVSIEGDLLLVGDANNNIIGQHYGATYVFKWNGSNYEQEAKIISSDSALAVNFGQSVSLNNGRALVGAWRYESSLGSAYIYKRDGTAWTEEAKLFASDGEQGDEFGLAVALSDEHALVAAAKDSDAGYSSGSVYVFKLSDGNWVEHTKLTASDAASTDFFGWSVGVSSQFAIVGAIGDDGEFGSTGAAYVFRTDGDTWVEDRKLSPSDGTPNDFFGSSVALGGGRALVGALGDDIHAENSGSAYLYSNVVPPVSVWLYVDSLYQVIPAEGDTVPFELQLTNTTADTQIVEYWSTLFSPNREPVTSVFGQEAVHLLPFEDETRVDQFPFNADLSAGTYTLINYVGSFPADTMSVDSTRFVKASVLPPLVTQSIPDQYVEQGFSNYIVADLDTVFDDSDSPELFYSFSTDGNTNGVIHESFFYLLGVSGFIGTSEVIVIASDEEPKSVSDTFQVFVEPEVGIEAGNTELPSQFLLHANHPNPFNPTTLISYELAAASYVRISIYDLLGSEIRVLVNEPNGQGNYTVNWDGKSSANKAVASGTYFYRMETSHGYTMTRKMLLIR